MGYQLTVPGIGFEYGIPLHGWRAYRHRYPSFIFINKWANVVNVTVVMVFAVLGLRIIGLFLYIEISNVIGILSS
jgi:sensor histidine kinase YesM